MEARCVNCEALTQKVRELEAALERQWDERTHDENVARAQTKRAEAAEAKVQELEAERMVDQQRRENAAFVQALEEGPAWQPIATAPKDGTLILIYGMNRKEREIRFIDTAVYDEGRSTYDGLGLWFCGTSSHPATHWMPLPAPPGDPSEGRATTNEDQARVDVHEV